MVPRDDGSFNKEDMITEEGKDFQVHPWVQTKARAAPEPGDASEQVPTCQSTTRFSAPELAQLTSHPKGEVCVGGSEGCFHWGRWDCVEWVGDGRLASIAT